MNFGYRLYGPDLQEAARCMGQARQDKAREKRRAVARQMRVEMGLEPLEALR